MRRDRLYRILRELFGEVLKPHGFSSEGSRRATHHRKVSETVYHFISPTLATYGAWYQVFVFPSSPVIDPSFEDDFPDGLGIPNDRWSTLSDHGVGMDSRDFNCKYEENLRRRFESTVRPLLLEKALPYLDGIKTVEDMIPLIKPASFRAFALYEVGRKDEARQALLGERERLTTLDDGDARVARMKMKVEQLLAAL